MPKTPVSEKIIECTYVHMPADCLGKAHKFARPFKSAYRMIRLFANDAEVKLISKPQAGTIRVAFNRVHKCPSEIKNADPPAASVELEDNMQPVCEPKCRQARLATVVSEQAKPVQQPTTQTIERPWNNQLQP